MILHLAQQARRHKRNGRFQHCFQDEDGMGWLKGARAIVCVCGIFGLFIFLSEIIIVP